MAEDNIKLSYTLTGEYREKFDYSQLRNQLKGKLNFPLTAHYTDLGVGLMMPKNDKGPSRNLVK